MRKESNFAEIDLVLGYRKWYRRLRKGEWKKMKCGAEFWIRNDVWPPQMPHCHYDIIEKEEYK